MTDAYEDLFSLVAEENTERIEVASRGRTEADPSQGFFEPFQAAALSPEATAQRREEFREWLSQRSPHRGASSNMKLSDRVAAEERRARRLAKLQERLAAAEAARSAALAALQARAAARRESAAERNAAAAERSAEAAGRLAAELEAGLAAAAGRRRALREAELERLRSEHELVMSRLAASQERSVASAAEALSRLQERLQVAAKEREAALARRAARAGSKVNRARVIGAQLQAVRQQKVQLRREALEQKLEAARQRRQEHRPPPLALPQEQTAQAGDAGATATVAGAAAAPGSADAVAPGEGTAAQAGRRAAASSPEPAVAATSTAPVPALADAVKSACTPDTATAVHESSPDKKTVEDGGAEPSSASAQLEGLRRTLSSRRLQAGWRSFVARQRTTHALAEAFVATGVTGMKVPTKTVAEGGGSGPATALASPPPRAASGGGAVVIGLGSPRRPAPGAGGGGGAEEGDSFERFASALRAPETLKATQALMRRLEKRLEVRNNAAALVGQPHGRHGGQAQSRASGGGAGGGGQSSGAAANGGGAGSQSTAPAADNAVRLLRRLFPRSSRDAPLERYPPRVLLCAFMVVRHPEVVFSGAGPREAALADAARELVSRFELLLERILLVRPDSGFGSGSHEFATANGRAEAPVVAAGAVGGNSGSADALLCPSPVGRGLEEYMARRRREAASGGGGGGGERCAGASVPPPSLSSAASAGSLYVTIGSLLVAFDDAWLRYLDQFVAWKGADAAALESELVRCAAALEASMLRKCRGDPTSERVRGSADLQAVLSQTAHDQALLRERVAKLGGEAGLARLQAALEAARAAVAAEAAERGWAASASASAAASESEATDNESPARRSPRDGGSQGSTPPITPPRRHAAAGPPSAAAASPTTSRPPGSPLPPLVLPPGMPVAVSPVAPAGAAAPLHGARASAPIPVPRRPAAADACVVSAPTLSPMSASPRSPSSLASTSLPPAAPLDAALVSNAALVHEMLLGASSGGYRLSSADAEAAWSRAVAAVERGTGGLSVLPPGPEPEELQAMGQEQLVQALRSRTTAIAECAFWDNVATSLEGVLQPARGPSAPEPAAAAITAALVMSRRLASLLAPLLAEVAADVASVMNNSPQAASLRVEFAESTLQSAIETAASETAAAAAAAAAASPAAAAAAASACAGAALQRGLGCLERLAGLLVAAGAPAREEAAVAAHAAARRRLGAVAASWAEAAAATGATEGGDSEVDSDDSSSAPAAATRARADVLAGALAGALRLLAAQVKLLKVDAAQGRLQALAASLQANGAVAYLRSKFATIFRLPMDAAPAASAAGDAAGAASPISSPGATAFLVAGATAGQATATAGAINATCSSLTLLQALPRTAAWLQRSRTAAAGILQYISSQGIDLRAAAAAAATSAATAAAVPAHLRAGRRQLLGDAVGGGVDAAKPNLAVAPVVPVGPDGEGSAAAGSVTAAASVGATVGGEARQWRWLVRCGVAAMVASDVPAVGPGLAETLLWDGERLHAAQNDFQQLVVVTAGLLLVTQLRSAAPVAGAATSVWGPEARASAARRLLAVAADPGMRLPHLTTEVAALAGVAVDEEAEARLRKAFMSLMDPSSAGFRSINNALGAALLLHMALGPAASPPAAGVSGASSGAPASSSVGGGAGGGPAAAAAAGLLARVGAGGLAADVAALGSRLLAVCAVNEAVHGELYERLCGEMLQGCAPLRPRELPTAAVEERLEEGDEI